MIRVLIADDHPVVRAGLKQVLATTPDLAVAGEAASAREVLDAVHSEVYDVVVLDMNMPDRSGLDVLQDLKRLHPALPVLVLSLYTEEHFALRVLRAGAAGYLSKADAPEKLIEAIRKVHTGSRYVSAALAEHIVEAMGRGPETPLHARLSDREYQVLCMLATGKTVGQIAEVLTLSVTTVSTYRVRVLKKLNLKTTADLVSYALRHWLVE
ncbi:response regulator [Nitrospira sp. Kam-Ns4a]